MYVRKYNETSVECKYLKVQVNPLRTSALFAALAASALASAAAALASAASRWASTTRLVGEPPPGSPWRRSGETLARAESRRALSELPPFAHDLAGDGRQHVRKTKEGNVRVVGVENEERLSAATVLSRDEALPVVLNAFVRQGKTQGAGHCGLDELQMLAVPGRRRRLDQDSLGVVEDVLVRIMPRRGRLPGTIMPRVVLRARDDPLHEALEVPLDGVAVVDERERNQFHLILRGEGALLSAPVVQRKIFRGGGSPCNLRGISGVKKGGEKSCLGYVLCTSKKMCIESKWHYSITFDDSWNISPLSKVKQYPLTFYLELVNYWLSHSLARETRATVANPNVRANPRITTKKGLTSVSSSAAADGSRFPVGIFSIDD